MTIVEVQEKALKVKATNGSASLGGENTDVTIHNHLLNESKTKLRRETKGQDTEGFITRVKGDPTALTGLCASVKTAKETISI